MKGKIYQLLRAKMIHVRCIFIVFALLFSFVFEETGAQEQPVSNRPLVVATKEAPPFAMKSRNGTWTGISIELWRRIAAELNLQFEFKELTIQSLLEGITDGTLDLAVAALTITPEREKNVDFTHPFYITGLSIAVVSKGGNPWLAVGKRFFSLAFLKIVVMLTFLLLIVGMLVWWFERKKNPNQFDSQPFSGISSGFWWSAVTMTTVGYGDKAPVSFGGRILAITWMFAGIIIISSFTAAITAVLTVTQLESPIKGPQDLPKVSVGTIMNSTSESYLRENRISFQTYKTLIDGLEDIAAGKIDALVYDAPLLRYLVNQRFQGKLDVLPNTFLRQDYGIALPAGSPLREPINRILLKEIQGPQWQDTLYRYLGG